MGQKSGPVKEPAEQLVKEIRRATRRQFSAEEKNCISWAACAERTASPSCAAARGSSRTSITACRKSSSRPARSALPAARRGRRPSDQVKDLRREAGASKEVVAEMMPENRLLKKARSGLGRTVHAS